MRLTKQTIGKLAIPVGKSELLVFDEALPGFGIRLRAGGKRTWVAQYRLGTKQRRIGLGNVEAVDPDEARRRARDALANVQLGKDPQAEKHTARREASATLGAIVDRYLTNHASKALKPRTFQEVDRSLRRHWASLAETPINKLSRAAVAECLDMIARDSGPFASNRSRAYLSAAFGWAIGKGLADANPVVGTHKATAELSRERTLSVDELAALIQSTGTGDYGRIILLLVLTGQRREEVGGMCWSEIDLPNRLWSIPKERTKNGRPHDVPLSQAAVDLITALRRNDDRDLVFGSGEAGFSGWSKAKVALDRRMLAMLREGSPRAPLLPWRLHDIRRTVATRLADLGTTPHVIEAILNHVSGHKAGVAGVYNRSTYLPEKREALERWAGEVSRLVMEEENEGTP